MKRWVCFFLVFGSLFSVAGCQKNALPQPSFPLEADAANAALEQTGLPWVISEPETQSFMEGHIAYTLRDPVETYAGTENKLVNANLSSARVEGERFLSAIFPSPSAEPGTLPVAWEDWKRQIVFATLLFGGFADEEEVYRAFSGQEPPAGEEPLEWDATLPGGYCRASYQVRNTQATSSSLGNTILKQSVLMRLDLYTSESLYQKLHQEGMEQAKGLESGRAEAPN